MVSRVYLNKIKYNVNLELMDKHLNLLFCFMLVLTAMQIIKLGVQKFIIWFGSWILFFKIYVKMLMSLILMSLLHMGNGKK